MDGVRQGRRQVSGQRVGRERRAAARSRVRSPGPAVVYFYPADGTDGARCRPSSSTARVDDYTGGERRARRRQRRRRREPPLLRARTRACASRSSSDAGGELTGQARADQGLRRVRQARRARHAPARPRCDRARDLVARGAGSQGSPRPGARGRARPRGELMPGHLVQQSESRRTWTTTASRRASRSTARAAARRSCRASCRFPIGRSQRSAMAGHEQSLFVLSGTATLYLDGHGPPRADARHGGLHRLGRVVLDRERRPRPARRAGRRRAHARRRRHARARRRAA